MVVGGMEACDQRGDQIATFLATRRESELEVGRRQNFQNLKACPQ